MGNMSVSNQVRSFNMYQCLEVALLQFIKQGDDFSTIAVYDETIHDGDDVEMLDVSVINLVKFISTAYGMSYFDDASTIVNAMGQQGERKKLLRFRSKHPLYRSATMSYQNTCLVSGMIYMGIPIEGYFDGDSVLV